MDQDILQADWTVEAGTVTFHAAVPPTNGSNYAETDSDGATLVRANVSSVYRVASLNFRRLSGTAADALMYLGMRDAAGDSVRVEVSIDYSGDIYTATMYQQVDGVDTLIDGPESFAISTTDPDTTIQLIYDPDYATVSWSVAGPNYWYQEPVYRVANVVPCALALRDLVAGTPALNGQTFAIGRDYSFGAYSGYKHLICFCDCDREYAPIQLDLTLSGLAATGTQMVRLGGGFAATYKWLPEWAATVNDTYRAAIAFVASNCSWQWNKYYPAVSTVPVDVEIWFGEVYDHTETDVDHSLWVYWVASVTYAAGQTTLEMLLQIRDFNAAPRSDSWYWEGAPPYGYTYSPALRWSKTWTGPKDLRELVDEELTFDPMYGNPYLDVSAATLRVSAVNS